MRKIMQMIVVLFSLVLCTCAWGAAGDELLEGDIDTEAEFEAICATLNFIVSTEIDTEAKLEALLGDVTNVFTNNDGALNDDDVTLADVQGACTNDFHNIGGTDDERTQEEVDDFVNALIKDADSVHTRITITYDDVNNAFDFVVDDMNDDVPEADDYINLSGGNAITHSPTGTLNFDGGASPGGELGNTWASPTVDSGIHDDEYVELEDAFVGDVTGTYDATVVGDDSHNHTSATISGLDISDDTNLAVDADELTLTGDSLGLANHTTARTAIGLGTGNSPTFTGITLSDNLLMADGKYIGLFGAERIVFDAAGDISVMGANFGVGGSPNYLLEAARSTAGGLESFRIINTDNTNSASAARSIVATGGSSSGDPRFVLSVLGITEYYIGIDNSDSDKFKIGSGSNPSAGSNFLTIQTDGNIGLGTPSPNEIFHAKKTSGNTAIEIESTTGDAYLILNSDTDELQDSEIIFESGGTARGRIEYDHNVTAADQKINFKVGDDAVTAMTICGSGDVGIGSTAEPSDGGKVLFFGDLGGDGWLRVGTDTAGIYGTDEGGTVELHGIDESGNKTQLTSHPPFLSETYNPEIKMTHGFKSSNPYVGWSVEGDLVAMALATQELYKEVFGKNKTFVKFTQIIQKPINEWKERQRESYTQEWIEDNTIKVEIPQSEAFETVQVEVDDPEAVIIDFETGDTSPASVLELVEYQIKDGKVVPRFKEVYLKKQVDRVQLKADVHFDSITGTLYRKVLPTKQEIKLVRDAYEPQLPKWLADRLKGAN